MRRLFLFCKFRLFVVLCLWAMGCSTSPPTNFYLLSPLPAADLQEPNARNQPPAIIRVDAVVVPGYLDRNEIVTRVSENQIYLADLNQWGEPLRDSLTNLLAVNLSRLLPTTNFTVFPFKCPTHADYQVSVEIIQMDGRLNGNVHLIAQWSILKGKENDIMITRKSVFKAPEAPSDYDALVAAQSRLVEALSREIAINFQANL